MGYIGKSVRLRLGEQPLFYKTDNIVNIDLVTWYYYVCLRQAIIVMIVANVYQITRAK